MELQKITGFFKVIIFEGNDNFKIAKFKMDDYFEKTITVTGAILDIYEELNYCLYGVYNEHPKYGIQFDVLNYEIISEDNEASLMRFFCSPIFPKVGKKAATLIIEQLGTEAFNMLKKDITIIQQVVGLSEVQKKSIQEGMLNSESVNDSILFLSQHGVSQKNIQKISVTYREEALKIVQNNPYRLILDIDGIGFKTADKLAQSLGFSNQHPFRVKAGIVYYMNDYAMSTGNTYMHFDEVHALYNRYFEAVEQDTFQIILNELHRERLIIYDTDNDVYIASQYDAERGIANYVVALANEKSIALPSTIDADIKSIEEDMNITYEEKQIEAIKNILKETFSIVTGGPGTGKTTIVRGVLAMFESLYPNYEITLCAPTGRAAKRLSQLTEHGATTIHSLLKWDLESNTFGLNEEEPLQTNVLIIDEFSMVDAHLFYQTLKAAHHVDKIILIGDENQLPSVGPGFVLKDIIAANCVSLTRLNKIYRQQEGSDIVSLAHEIKQGRCESLTSSQDAKFFEAKNYRVKHLVSQIVSNALEKGYDIQDIQVLVPLYKGVAGIDEINRCLQQLINPFDECKKELRFGYRTLREQDKVLQLKNQPDDDVYNGDIGTIIEIITKEDDYENKDRIICDFDDIIVEYTADNFHVITHAYCISIHKSQGSEYPIVIMPIVKDYEFMLQRRLVYTGITRAKKSIVLIGSKEVLEKGIQSEEKLPRMTKLTKRILQSLQSEEDSI